MLQLNDAVDPESPGAAVLHPADTEEGVEVAFTPPEAGRSLGHGASVACCPPLQTLTPFHVHNPTMQAKVKDYFVFRVSCNNLPQSTSRPKCLVRHTGRSALQCVVKSTITYREEREDGLSDWRLCDADLSQVPSSRLWATSGAWHSLLRMERCSVFGCLLSKYPSSMWLVHYQTETRSICLAEQLWLFLTMLFCKQLFLLCFTVPFVDFVWDVYRIDHWNNERERLVLITDRQVKQYIFLSHIWRHVTV